MIFPAAILDSLLECFVRIFNAMSIDISFTRLVGLSEVLILIVKSININTFKKKNLLKEFYDFVINLFLIYDYSLNLFFRISINNFIVFTYGCCHPCFILKRSK